MEHTINKPIVTTSSNAPCVIQILHHKHKDFPPAVQNVLREHLPNGGVITVETNNPSNPTFDQLLKINNLRRDMVSAIEGALKDQRVTAELRDLLAGYKVSSNRLYNLVEQILDLARLNQLEIQNLAKQVEALTIVEEVHPITYQKLGEVMEENFKNFRLEIRTELKELRNETKAGLNELRNETKAGLNELRNETKAGLKELRNETEKGFALMRLEIITLHHNQAYETINFINYKSNSDFSIKWPSFKGFSSAEVPVSPPLAIQSLDTWRKFVAFTDFSDPGQPAHLLNITELTLEREIIENYQLGKVYTEYKSIGGHHDRLINGSIAKTFIAENILGIHCDQNV